MIKRTLSVLTLVILSGAWAQAQTIADVARQERARRQNTHSTITITTDSLRSANAISPAVDSVEAENEAKAPAASPEKAGNASATVRDEKSWRSAFQKAREEVRRAEDQVAILQLALNQARLDLLQRSDIYNRETRLAPEIARLTMELDLAQKDVVNGRQGITQLEEELRRAGGPPGWSR